MRINSSLTVLGIAWAGAVALPASVGAQTAPGTTITSICDGSDAYCAALAELADLQATVAELVPDLRLAFSLNVKLQAATNAVLGGQYAAALGQLAAFGNEVNAAQQSGQLNTNATNILKKQSDTAGSQIQNLKAS